MRVLGVSPREFVGASRVLKELSNIGLADFVYLDSLELPLKHDLVIFAGFHPSYNVLIPRIEAERWVLWTSPLLQAELAEVEIPYLECLLHNDDIQRIWVGSKGCYEALKDVSEKVFYCPYPVDVKRVRAHKAEVEKDAVGMFLPFHNRQKNIYGQLAACRIFQKEHPLKLYTNGMLPSQRRFANNIGVLYEDLGFLPEDEYYRWVQKFQLMLHVTLSESWAYVVSDAMLLGTPCLVSRALDWVDPSLGLTVENPDSPVEIAEKMRQALASPTLSKRVERNAFKIAKRNNHELTDFFMSILEEDSGLMGGSSQTHPEA